MLRKTHFDQTPLKPQRVYEEMNKVFGRETCYVTTIGLSQIAGAQFLHVYKPRNWINCGQAGPLGWTLPAALGVRAADPDRPIVALSGDYDFQFMIEELAVGAQHKLPYLHVVVNNSYLGLIRQAQRGFDMDFEVSLAFDNINASGDAEKGYGVDHVAVAEGLGCKAIRVRSPNQFAGRICRGAGSDGRAPGTGRDRVHPGARHQRLHGCGYQRGRRVRGPCRAQRGCADCGLRISRLTTQFNREACMPKFAANLTMLFNEVPFMERFALASEAGFEAVEYLFPYDYKVEELRHELGRKPAWSRSFTICPPATGAAGERGIAVLPDRIDEFRRGVATAIDYATALGCKQINCLAGIAPNGLADDILRTTLVHNLEARSNGTCQISTSGC